MVNYQELFGLFFGGGRVDHQRLLHLKVVQLMVVYEHMDFSFARLLVVLSLLKHTAGGRTANEQYVRQPPNCRW